MVTTGANNFDLDTDSSERGLDIEQPEKPAPKRQKIKKLNSSGDDSAFNPESSSRKGKGKATCHRNELITRRGGKGGRLRDLMNMPVDIFTEVCSYLDPHDLRRLALTSKRLWDILMTKEARHIWKTAIASVPNLPICPNDLNEPQYVCLLYSSECYSIGCTSRGTKVDWFHRVRFCQACHVAKMTNEWHLKHNKDSLDLGFDEATLSQVQSFLKSGAVGWRKNGERHYLVEALKNPGRKYQALSPEEAEGYLSTLRVTHKDRRETGGAMAVWNYNNLISRASEIATQKHARFESIKVKLLEMGWDEEDFPNSNKEFRDLVWKDQKLTPKIWQNIRPRLERLLETGRNERLAIEKLQRLSNRKKAIIRLYHRLCRDVMDLPFDHSHLNHLHPDAAGIYALPSIKTLLENDTETFTEEQLIEVAPDARLMVLKWWRDCLKQLLEYAVGGKTSPSNQPDAGAQEVVGPESDTEDAISGSIEVLRATLTRGTSHRNPSKPTAATAARTAGVGGAIADGSKQ